MPNIDSRHPEAAVRQFKGSTVFDWEIEPHEERPSQWGHDTRAEWAGPALISSAHLRPRDPAGPSRPVCAVVLIAAMLIGAHLGAKPSHRPAPSSQAGTSADAGSIRLVANDAAR